MKKVLMWFGASALLIIIVLAVSLIFATWDKPSWDDATKSNVRSTVLSLNKLSSEQLYNYWGANPPGTKEERDKIIDYSSTLGELVKINYIKVINYRNSVSLFGQGVTHFYTYEASTDFTSGPVIFKFLLKGNKDQIEVLNLNISRGNDI